MKKILSVLLALILAAVLVSCADNTPKVSDEELIKQTVDTLMSGIMTLDAQKVQSVIKGEIKDGLLEKKEVGPELLEVFKQWNSGLKYEITDTEITDGKAKVSLETEFADAGNVMEAVAAELIPKVKSGDIPYEEGKTDELAAALKDMIIEKAKSEAAGSTPASITLDLEKTDKGEWLISELPDKFEEIAFSNIPGFFSGIIGMIDSDDDTEEEFNYSNWFDEDGYWKDIVASEYVTLSDIDRIEIKKADVDDYIDDLLENFPYEKEVTDRTVEETDSVNIDYVGSVNGVEFEGGSTGGQGTTVNIKTTNYIEGFLPQLVGHKPGETFDINVTFPSDYGNTDLAGKDAVFRITVNYIVDFVKGEWNDEFVQEMLLEDFGWSTTEAAEKAIMYSLIEEYLVDSCKIKKDIPGSMIDYQQNAIIAYYKDYADSYGLDLEEFLYYYLQVESIEDILDYYKEDTETYCQTNLIYQAIAEKLDIKVSEDDLKEYFLKAMGSEDYSSIEEIYGLPYVKHVVMSETLLEKLVSSAVIVD